MNIKEAVAILENQTQETFLLSMEIWRHSHDGAPGIPSIKWEITFGFHKDEDLQKATGSALEQAVHLAVEKMCPTTQTVVQCACECAGCDEIKGAE